MHNTEKSHLQTKQFTFEAGNCCWCYFVNRLHSIMCVTWTSMIWNRHLCCNQHITRLKSFSSFRSVYRLKRSACSLPCYLLFRTIILIFIDYYSQTWRLNFVKSQWGSSIWGVDSHPKIWRISKTKFDINFAKTECQGTTENERQDPKIVIMKKPSTSNR